MRVHRIIIAFTVLIISQSLSVHGQWLPQGASSGSIYYNGGNVGIGTSTPVIKLHISGGHMAATASDLSSFVQLWSDNAIIWKSGSIGKALRFGSANDLNAANWSEKMRITDDGNVGIGTYNPVATLNVEAANQTIGDDAALFDKPRIATSAAYRYTFESVGGVLANNIGPFWRGFHLAAPYITVNGANTFPRLAFYAEYDSYTDPTSKKWVINAGNATVAHDIQFISNDVNLMYLTAKGNVGIGSTSPAAKLDLNFFNNNSTVPQNGLLLETNSFYTSDNAANSYFLKTLDQGNGAVAFIIKGDGSVGIGTSTPKAKLAVNGDILSKKVTVSLNNLPDYVFDEGYSLRPLHEVEQYIQQNHHLPEVPTAEEVKKDGLDVGDNQATLLKKIEELTLYVIEQNKKLQELDQRLIEYKQENEQLKAVLKSSDRK